MLSFSNPDSKFPPPAASDPEPTPTCLTPDIDLGPEEVEVQRMLQEMPPPPSPPIPQEIAHKNSLTRELYYGGIEEYIRAGDSYAEATSPLLA
jgi:hypothetical protein